MEASHEGGQGPEGAVAPYMDGFIALRSAHTVLPVCLVKQFKCFSVKCLPSLQQNFTHTHLSFSHFH
jgi:hypothetical protein